MRCTRLFNKSCIFHSKKEFENEKALPPTHNMVQSILWNWNYVWFDNIKRKLNNHISIIAKMVEGQKKKKKDSFSSIQK